MSANTGSSFVQLDHELQQSDYWPVSPTLASSTASIQGFSTVNLSIMHALMPVTNHFDNESSLGDKYLFGASSKANLLDLPSG
jgi:hypothetical protein